MSDSPAATRVNLPLFPRLTVLARLALRNVRRQARRSALTASAMVIGLALLMISRAIADGAHESWIADGVRLGSGHVAIQAPGYLDSHSLADRLEPTAVARVHQALAAPTVAPQVRAVVQRLTVSGLASSPASAVPISIMGVDPATEARFSPFRKDLVRGRYLEPGDRLGAFVGQGLVTRLGLKLGNRFVLTAQAADGQIAGQLMRVVGVFKTGIPEVDDGLIQVPITTVQRWLGAPDAVSTVAVLLRSSRETPTVVRRLRRLLPAAGDSVAVLSWRQASPELDSAVRVDDLGDYMFLFILLAIVALAILNAVLMSVLNRTREFGVLQALGMTRRQTGLVVFTEGLVLAAASGLVGAALGFGVTWLFWRHGMDLSALWGNDWTVSGITVSSIIVPEFRFAQVLQSVVFILVIGSAASLYPSYQATRIDVAEAMKFDR